MTDTSPRNVYARLKIKRALDKIILGIAQSDGNGEIDNEGWKKIIRTISSIAKYDHWDCTERFYWAREFIKQAEG